MENSNLDVLKKEIIETQNIIKEMKKNSEIEVDQLVKFYNKQYIHDLELYLDDLYDNLDGLEDKDESLGIVYVLKNLEKLYLINESKPKRLLNTLIMVLKRGIRHDFVGTSISIGILFAAITTTFSGFLIGIFFIIVIARFFERI